jgi:hypothetical protein
MTQFSKSSRELGRTLEQLFDAQPDDARLRDNLEGLQRDRALPGLTWFWGPYLYQRNRVLFGPFIHQHFSEWEQSSGRWARIAWQTHADQLETWLAAARMNRDTGLVRKLLRWKFASKGWALDSARWCASLVADYSAAAGAAARAIVLEEHDDWFELDEATALALYELDRRCSPFLLRHLPHRFSIWGGEKRALWKRMFDVAVSCADEELAFALFRRQAPIKEWQAEVNRLAANEPDAVKLNDELRRRHPEGWGLKLGDVAIELLKQRGRDVMPYVREKLEGIVGDWQGSPAEPVVRLAEQRGWWDLWAASIRASRTPELFNKTVAQLLADTSLTEPVMLERLRALAGVSREWNWPGLGLARIHSLEDATATAFYARYPELLHGPFKPHVIPTWWRGSPQLLAAAQKSGDDALVDLLASRYATQVRYEMAYMAKSEQDRNVETALQLGDLYQSLRDRDAAEFARRAANVLTRIPAYAIRSYNQLLRTNKLARLLFVRSFDAYLAVPESVRDLVEASEVHVQMLGYRVLSQDDERARRMAVEVIDILIGTLLRPLHRKTRQAAFGALMNAARADGTTARMVLRRARDALRLPDKKYPKERLIGLIGGVLAAYPELRIGREVPVVFGYQEATA